MDNSITLEKQLGYTFNDKSKLMRALTHPSFSKETGDKNPGEECLDQSVYATLGDAVLKTGLILILMDAGAEKKGDLTIWKSDIEKNSHLATVGIRLHLLEKNFIRHRVGRDEKLKEGSETLCADTLEAIIGAIFIDSNYSMEKIMKFLYRIFAPEIDEIKKKIVKRNLMKKHPD